MFADFFHFKSRRGPTDYNQTFIASAVIRPPEPRSRRVEKVILGCWGLIAVKQIAVIWAVSHYAVPFHPLWINAPTFFLGLLATVAYYRPE
ncbi:MAG: hypothetical protein EBT98_04370 [Opitutaceae bacterium]|nr:hypothetical protein [Opitutaceae bacterium]NBR57946.1 hypothetical protein [Opitutaceae bacterium]